MGKVKTFKELRVWQVASNLAKEISTDLSKILPKNEKYKISDQIRRSARSIPANIACPV